MSTVPERTEVQALLARGNEYAVGGDPRAAVTFYQAALDKARTTRVADMQTITELQQAQAFIQSRVQEFQTALDRAVAAAEPANSVASLRLVHALDMLKGRRIIYPQQPSMLFFPYLAQRQFFEREEFEWATAIEAAAPAIRAELKTLLSENAEFRPYVEDDPDRPARNFHGLNNDLSWTAFYLCKHGGVIEENAQRCPATVRALEAVPLSRIGERTPSVFFSRLAPGAHIEPHTGMLNSRLICHLPLIIPPGGWLRVGNETREWSEGELLIFDDSIEHEAKNPSGEERIVLIFDIWRPELTQAERDGISAMFDAIDQFQSLPDQ